MTRREAIKLKNKMYNTGKPCKNGHFADRYTIDGACSVCRSEYQKADREAIRLALKEA